MVHCKIRRVDMVYVVGVKHLNIIRKDKLMKLLVILEIGSGWCSGFIRRFIYLQAED